VTAEVRVTCPAKINLALGVGSVREDGYHPLATVYQAVALFDEVTMRPADEDALTVSGDGIDVSGVPLDSSNLVLRAVHALAEHAGRALPVSVHVRKHIPVAGGLAGGSSDAAAALVGADALFGLGLPRPELLEVAATLGSDVPFCVVGGTALGSGRGELVTPVMTRGQYWWVLCPDDQGLSTPDVFRAFDNLHDGVPVPEPEVSDHLLAALTSGDPTALGPQLSNDLQAAALTFRPDLAELLRSGLQGGAVGGMVSGSGPTTAFLCSEVDRARDLAEHLRVEGVPAPLVVKGPVTGARVVSSRLSGGAP
jgi:4-diphosphocytidyl-2-C-methyl-D-erythritol kinase